MSRFMTRKFIFNSLNLILILVLLAIFFYYIPLLKILDVLKTITPPPLLWTLAVSLLAVYVASIELWDLTRKQGIVIPVHIFVR